MSDSVPAPNAGSITITVIPQTNGLCFCDVALSLDGHTGLTKTFCGQNPKHAIAIALENLAGLLRKEAEAEQDVDWDAVDRSPSGKTNQKCFHVILHYEWVAKEESKFAAMHNTLLGNTVVENAELCIIQVDPDLPIKRSKGRL